MACTKQKMYSRLRSLFNPVVGNPLCQILDSEEQLGLFLNQEETDHAYIADCMLYGENKRASLLRLQPTERVVRRFQGRLRAARRIYSEAQSRLDKVTRLSLRKSQCTSLFFCHFVSRSNVSPSTCLNCLLNDVVVFGFQWHHIIGLPCIEIPRPSHVPL